MQTNLCDYKIDPEEIIKCTEKALKSSTVFNEIIKVFIDIWGKDKQSVGEMQL